MFFYFYTYFIVIIIYKFIFLLNFEIYYYYVFIILFSFNEKNLVPDLVYFTLEVNLTLLIISIIGSIINLIALIQFLLEKIQLQANFLIKFILLINWIRIFTQLNKYQTMKNCFLLAFQYSYFHFKYNLIYYLTDDDYIYF